MRIVIIAPEQTRAKLRDDLTAQGVQILAETADRDGTLQHLGSLQPELVLLECQSQLASSLAWAEQAIALQPGVVVCMLGPALESHQLLAVMRAGVREYLPEATPAMVLEAVARVRQSVRKAPEPAPAPRAAGPAGKVAVVYSPKGGVGKSTLAANLAVALYQTTNIRVNLLDLSLQFGDQDLLLNLQPQKSIADLAPVINDLDARALEQTFTPSPIGVRLLAAPSRFEDSEAIAGVHVERTFEALRAQKGWTVVDTASQLDAASVRAIELADVVLVPMVFDLATIRRMVRVFAVWQEFGIDTDKVKLVAWKERGAAAEIGASDVARTLGRPVSYQLPWDPQGVAASVNQGVPMLIGQPSAPLSQAMLMMAAEVAGVVVPEKTKESAIGNLFGQAFGWFRKKEVKLLTAGSTAP